MHLVDHSMLFGIWSSLCFDYEFLLLHFNYFFNILSITTTSIVKSLHELKKMGLSLNFEPCFKTWKKCNSSIISKSNGQLRYRISCKRSGYIITKLYNHQVTYHHYHPGSILLPSYLVLYPILFALDLILSSTSAGSIQMVCIWDIKTVPMEAWSPPLWDRDLSVRKRTTISCRDSSPQVTLSLYPIILYLLFS